MTPLGLLISVVNVYSQFDAQADIQKSVLSLLIISIAKHAAQRE